MMKKNLLFLLVILSNTIIAQNVELSNKLIQTYHSKQMRSVSSNDIHDKLWLTPLLIQVNKNWGDLTENARSLFYKYQSRPTFSGTEKTTEIGNFRFHYTTNGPAGESVSATDSNLNGIPDYIDNMMSKFSSVYSLYHSTTGFTVPPGDGFDGGNAKFDIYVSGDEAGAGIYGYVQGEYIIGDNPNSTDLIEDSSVSSYMVMRNNYSGFGDENIALSVTAAHEYMHAIQMGYEYDEMDTWFMESAAVWSEDYAFPGYDDNLQYLPYYFRYPDVALNWNDYTDGSTYSGYWYGTFLFPRLITEKTSNNIIKNFYYRNVTQTTFNAINSELTTNWNSSFDDMYTKFIIANALLTSNTVYNPYTYSRADTYSSYIAPYGGLKYENASSQFDYTGSDINWSSSTNGNNRLMRLSSDFFKFTTNQNFKINFTCSSTQTKLILVMKNATQVSYASCSGGQSINVTDYANWTSFIPIVIRYDRTVTNTSSISYSLNITTATLGIEDIALKTNIYPNPTSDYLHVNTTYEGLKYSLFDFSGKNLKAGNLKDGENQVNLTDLNQGTYLIQIMKDNQVAKTQIIIKD